MTIRLMLVDDHKMLRDALRAVLEHEPEISLVAETDEAKDVLQLVRERLPDIVVMDIGLPRISGIEVTRQLLKEFPAIKVLALSSFSERRIILEMLDAGASGYVVKTAGQDELLRAIRALAMGRTYLCPDVSAVVINSVRGRKSSNKPQGEQLGRREQEVLKLLSEGRTSPEIGQILHIATSTVEVHRRNIMAKLELHSVAELTKYAIRQGLTNA